MLTDAIWKHCFGLLIKPLPLSHIYLCWVLKKKKKKISEIKVWTLSVARGEMASKEKTLGP